MGKVLSFQPRESKELSDSVEREWHRRFLEVMIRSATLVPSTHFRERMVEREIGRHEVDLLVDQGHIWAIEIGTDRPGLPEWKPKWILCWPSPEDWDLGGVFAYDGTRLVGITVYRRKDDESLPVPRNAA